MGDPARRQCGLRGRHGRRAKDPTRGRLPPIALSVCLDETSKQWIVETRAPIPQKPGQPARRDDEYERNGVANLFMLFAPPEGRRRVEVADRHAAVDSAKALKKICPTCIAPPRKQSCSSRTT